MNRNTSNLSLLLILVVMSSTLSAQPATTIEQQVREVLPNSIRTEDERNNVDNYRKPAETLAFFGLRNDMKVLELIPGGGYYTKILGQVLADKGKLYLGADGQRVAKDLPTWGLEKVEILEDGYELVRAEPRGHNIVERVEFPVKDLDMVLTFRNMHNLNTESRNRLNTAVFNALKSGGIYGVIDHTRRHMEPYDEIRWRRIDPVAMIKELQDIGFVFVDYSDLHYTPEDDLKLDTTDPSINRNSDRFTLKFRKP